MPAFPSDLRPDAQPLPFHTLGEDQQEAYRRLAEQIAAECDRLPEPTTTTAADESGKKSRVIVVSGGRGSGKTTAVLSFVHDAATVRKPKALPLPPLFAKAPDQEPTNDRKDREEAERTLRAAVETVARRVVWLDTLDMAPLPAAANLFTAVLVRLEVAFTRAVLPAAIPDGHRGLLAAPEVYDAPLERLRRLQTDVAVSWEGNLRERAGHLDATAFAEEVKRAEVVRLKLNTELTAVLDGFAAELSAAGRAINPLFVLPVDDFDLNPPRCLELLELLRTLSVPRLLCLALGDLAVAETVCGMQLAADIARVAGPAIRTKFLPVDSADVQATVASVSGNVIRKLLPPGQRMTLRPLSVEQALRLAPRFAASGPPAPDLDQLLADIPIDLANVEPAVRWRFRPACPPGVSDPPVAVTATGFLSAGGSDPFYYARQFLAMPYRPLVDFWIQLHDLRRLPLRVRGGKFLERLNEFTRELIRTDQGFPPDARQRLEAVVQTDPLSELAATADPYRLVPLESPAQTRVVGRVSYLKTATPHPLDLNWHVTGGQVRGWEFRGEAKKATRLQFAAQSTAQLLMFCTDVGTLWCGRGARNPLLDSRLRLARPQLVYRIGGKTAPPLGFPLPPVLTFWEADRLLTGWNRVLEQLQAVAPLDSLPFLVLNWIALGADVLTGSPTTVYPLPDVPLEYGWAAARDKLDVLLRLFQGRESETGIPVHRWAARVLSLLNPEVVGECYPAWKVFLGSERLVALAAEEADRFVGWAAEHEPRSDTGGVLDDVREVVSQTPTWLGRLAAEREGQNYFRPSASFTPPTLPPPPKKPARKRKPK